MQLTLKLSDLKLRQLTYFLAVADTSSFTQAASRTGATQSTISHQLAELEANLGVVLLDRFGRSVRLTEAGTILKSFAERAVANLENSLTALSELEGLTRGSLRLGVIQSLSHTLLPPVLSTFVTRHPGVTIEVTELSARDIEQGLYDGRFDLGLAFAPTLLPNLEFEPVLQEEMLLVADKRHPLTRRRRLPMPRLDGAKLALLDQTYSTRKLIDRHLDIAGAKPDIVLASNSMSVILAMVSVSGLATIIPERGFLPSRYPDLRAVRLIDPTPIRTSALLWPKNAFHRAAARAFASMIRKIH